MTQKLEKIQTPILAEEPKADAKQVLSPDKEEMVNFNKRATGIYMEPTYNASKLIARLKNKRTVQLEHVLEKLLANNIETLNGDFSHAEDVLLNQANALNELFYFALDKLMDAENLPEIQCHSEIAFRAQKNCRATITALKDLKDPRRTTFVKQQNIELNQQVNNLEVKEIQKPKNSANELLETTHGQAVDGRAQIAPITTYPQLEPVGKVNRSKN